MGGRHHIAVSAGVVMRWTVAWARNASTNLVAQPIERFNVFLAGWFFRKFILLVRQSALSESTDFLTSFVIFRELVRFGRWIHVRTVKGR
uniref:Putative secreted protein n=1 Tax=Anopheles darlingi TaxID=43151 RepID=A0A2M4DGZ8_ANODA